MEDRKASLIAAGLGGVALGSFWLARPTASHATLRILDQRIVPLGSPGSDPDAAAEYRIAESNLAYDASQEGRRIEYRLLGSEGQSYLLTPMRSVGGGSLKLRRGFAKGLKRPLLQLLVDGRPAASAPVLEVPDPREESLVPTPDAPFRLLNRGGPNLEVEPRHPLAKGERWRLTALRTTYAPHVEAETEVPSHFVWPNRNGLDLPYPEATRAMEVDLSRERMESAVETVRIPNLRLVERSGTVRLVVDRDTEVASVLGATIRLPLQDNGPHRASGRQRLPLAEANLVVLPPQRFRLEAEANSGHRSFVGYRTEIVSPTPESLGLGNLRIGSGYRRTARAPGPLRLGPFTATVRMTYLRFLPVDRRRLVVAVEKAPPRPNRMLDPSLPAWRTPPTLAPQLAMDLGPRSATLGRSPR